MPDAAGELDLVGLERHARAPAVAHAAPREVGGNVRRGDLDAGRDASMTAASATPCDSPRSST
jgi:hypothetical protein